MAVKKQYLYKISRDGVFLGVLPGVSDDFGYTLNINTAFTQATFMVRLDPETSRQAPSTIITEDGDSITTEDGSYHLTTERTPDLFGNGNSQALVRNGNDVEVYEFSSNNPNGVLRFSGYISRWRVNYDEDPRLFVTCLSNGTDLDQYVIQTGDSEVATAILEDTAIASAYWGFAVIQTIKPSVAISLNKITLKMKVNSGDDVTVAPMLYQGDPSSDRIQVDMGVTSYTTSNTKLADFASSHVTETSYTEKTYSLPSTQTLQPGETYYVLFWFSQGNAQNLSVRASNTLASLPLEKAYSKGLTANNSGFVVAYDTAKDSLWIKLISSTGNTESPFTSQDPTTILKAIIDNYISQGGIINYSPTSTTDTALSVSYTFKVNTALEGIKKCLELAPYNWYWYVNPATDIIYFKSVATTADHKFIRGRHINSLEIEAVTENLKNVVYFSGGDTGSGDNLFIRVTDTTSLASNRRGLERISDNRVTLTATATLLAQNFLDENSDEVYETTISIPDSTYDLTTVSVGQVVAFEGFGTMVDNLLLQIVGLTVRPNSVTLSLGVLPRRATSVVETINRQLNDLQTIANPATPS